MKFLLIKKPKCKYLEINILTISENGDSLGVRASAGVPKTGGVEC